MAVNVTYQVYTGGRWLPNVTNLTDYAGIYGSPIQGVYANLSTGSIRYKVHTINGAWLPAVTDRTDYAGIIGQNIDGLQMEVVGLSGYQARYRVHTTNGTWLPWVKGLEDYAGIYGQAIDAIEVEIVADSSGGGSSVDVTYQVYTGGRWLPNVTNLTDYAGIYGSAIQGIYANLSRGNIRYKVHTTNGSWLPWVTDRTDYAGILGQNIDGLQMEVINLSGYTVNYRAYVGGRWLPWVKGLEDYAGIFGQSIEAIQVEIITGSSGGGEILPPVPGGRKVFIDPGHGGSDPGAGAYHLQEKDVVLSISKKVGNILTQQGVTVEYSRQTDTYVSLEGRAQQANNWGASLFVSVHANSNEGLPGTGTECYTYPATDAANKRLSANVASAISNKLGLVNRGHKEADFAVLRLTNMPAILVETAFINNANDVSKLRYNQDDFAMAIATEILKYLGEAPPSFDVNVFNEHSSNIGLFSGLGMTFTAESKVIKTLSLVPLVTLSGETSIEAKLMHHGPVHQIIDFAQGVAGAAKKLIDVLKEANIPIPFSESELTIGLSNLGVSGEINDRLAYNVEMGVTETGKSYVEMMLESSFEYNEDITGYQRLILKAELDLRKNHAPIPIAIKNPSPQHYLLPAYNGEKFETELGYIQYKVEKALEPIEEAVMPALTMLAIVGVGYLAATAAAPAATAYVIGLILIK